jgi:hypothetical protein
LTDFALPADVCHNREQRSAPPEFVTFNSADCLARQGVYSLIDCAQAQWNTIAATLGFIDKRCRVV